MSSMKLGVCHEVGIRMKRIAKFWKVARIGDNMREVAGYRGDKVEAQIRLGFSVNGIWYCLDVEEQ